MPEYIVLAARHREVTTTRENGETRTTSKVYKKGDTVTMKADDADRLVRTGGLRPVDQDGAETVVGARLPDSAVPIAPVTVENRVESPGALSGQTAEEGLREASVPSPEALEAHAAALKAADEAREAFQAEQGTKDEVPDDGYDDLEYSDLVAEAKKRELPHTGKKKEIVARLRAHDADTSDEDDEDGDENDQQ